MAASLVSLLRISAAVVGAEHCAQWTAAALCNMARQGDVATRALIDAGVVLAINETLAARQDSHGLGEMLLGLLCNLATSDAEEIVAAGCVEQAIEIITACRATSPRAARMASSVLNNMLVAGDDTLRSQVSARGAAPALQALADSATFDKRLRKNAALALDNLQVSGGRKTGGSKMKGAGSGSDGRKRPKKKLQAVLEPESEPLRLHSASRASISQVLDFPFPPPLPSQYQPPVPLPPAQPSLELAVSAAAQLLLSHGWSEISVEALNRHPHRLLAAAASASTSAARTSGGGAEQRPKVAGANLVARRGLMPWVDAARCGSMPLAVGSRGSDAAARRGKPPAFSVEVALLSADLAPTRQSSPLGPPVFTFSSAERGQAARGDSRALQFWALDILNFFLPSGVHAVEVVRRCFGSEHTRREDFIDAAVMRQFEVTVVLAVYGSAAAAASAHQRLLQDPLIAEGRGRGWPLRLVLEHDAVKTYVPVHTNTDNTGTTGSADALSEVSLRELAAQMSATSFEQLAEDPVSHRPLKLGTCAASSARER